MRDLEGVFGHMFMTPCWGGRSGVGLCTFRAESRQLVTEAFPPPCGHDQEHIPARQCQVNRS